MNNKHFLHLALMAASLGLTCRADTVFLTDGTEVTGQIVEENNTTVAVKKANGAIQSFRRGDVDTIVYDKKKNEEVAEKKEPVPAPATKPTEKKPATAEVKTNEAKPATGTAEAPKTAETPKTGDTPSVKTPDGAKTDSVAGEKPKTDPAKAGKPDDKDTTEAKPDDKDKKEGTGDKKEEAWSPPANLPGFPDKAKRMPKEKEEIFMAQLARMESTNPDVRAAARSAVASMGPDALPYVVAGIQHQNVEARSTCMSLVGQLNGRTAVKQVIEVFYSAMPENDAAPSYQVPFIRSIKETLPAITGQSFIYVQPDKALVTDGLKKYVAWYNENYDRLPPQLGEPKIEATDPDYAKKLKEARKLKLEKKSWPRPASPADLVTGTKTPPASDSERPGDKAFKDTVKTVKREDAGKRQ
jgi:hypothetical protein